MTDRPAKLTPLSLLVIWSCPAPALSLGEKVVWYRDWSLDRGDANGCYASPASLSASLGASLTPGSVETMRQRLKRLDLHHPLLRPGAKNLGWVATIPAAFRPRVATEVPALAIGLAAYILAREAGPTSVEQSPRSTLKKLEQNPGSTLRTGGVSGGVGGVSSQELVENQLPSAVRDPKQQKGIGSSEPISEKRGQPGRLTDMVADKMREIARDRRRA